MYKLDVLEQQCIRLHAVVSNIYHEMSFLYRVRNSNLIFFCGSW